MKLFFFYFSFLSIILMGQNKFSSNTSLNKITTNDDYEYIAVNQLKMWIGNNGMGSHNPILDSHGLLWPGGENAVLNLAFADGLIWGGHIGDSLYVNGNTYRYGLQAGKILENGIADNPCFLSIEFIKLQRTGKVCSLVPPETDIRKIIWNGRVMKEHLFMMKITMENLLQE